jgi:hypothetical protein
MIGLPAGNNASSSPPTVKNKIKNSFYSAFSIIFAARILLPPPVSSLP